MNFTLKQLQIFTAVVKSGSTLAASEALNISQPAVSLAISELESGLGTPIFDRWKKRMILNERGRALVPAARLLLANAEEVDILFSGSQRFLGNLRIGASATLAGYVVPELIADFAAEHPAIKIDVVCSNKSGIISKIEDWELDIGFIAGRSSSQNIYNRPYLTDELCIFASSSHPLTNKETVTMEDLAQSSWIMREGGSGTKEVFMNSLPFGMGQLNVTMVSDNLELIKCAVAQSASLGCVSLNALSKDVNSGHLKILHTPYLNLKREYYIIMHKQRRKSSLLNVFIDFIDNFIPQKQQTLP